jgi:hypothetical protein
MAQLQPLDKCKVLHLAAHVSVHAWYICTAFAWLGPAAAGSGKSRV